MTAKGFAGSGAAREAVGTTEWPSATRQARPRRRSRSRTAATRTSCTAGASWRARATRRCVLFSTSSGSHCTGARGNARTSVLRRRIGGVECRIWVGSDLTSRRPADIRSALDDVRSRMGCSASRSTLVAAAAAGYVRSTLIPAGGVAVSRSPERLQCVRDREFEVRLRVTAPAAELSSCLFIGGHSG